MSHATRGTAAVAQDSTFEFAQDIRRSLQETPRQLPSKYLYDALGSSLFEAICRLPWYEITRAEHRLLGRWASRIVERQPEPTAVVELGCGSGEKLAQLVEGFGRRGRRVRVHLIDISAAALAQSEQRLADLEHVSVVGSRSTYERGLRQAARGRLAHESLLVLFLGSNIGNFDPEAAAAFLAEIRRALRPGDALLLGADLVKPEAELIAAYDDPLGVTAAFNRNLLVRLNRELDATFALDAFAHLAVWNAGASRVEMHLECTRPHTVRIPRADLVVHFEKGERIWTESSYKYEPDGIVRLAASAGFVRREQWIDDPAGFALTLFDVDRPKAVPPRPAVHTTRP